MEAAQAASPSPNVHVSGEEPSSWLAPLRLPGRLWRHRIVLGAMTRRDLASRFRGSVLGLLWPLIHPVSLFLVYLFLFSKLLAVSRGFDPEMLALPSDLPGENYFAMYLFSGVLIWTGFQEALQRSANVILENNNLIKKMLFPAEILPLAATLAGVVIQLFGMAVFLAFMIVGNFWSAPMISQLLVLPVLLVLQVFFTYGLGMIAATLQVFLRDTAHILMVILTFWMFLTPIFWIPELILDKSDDLSVFLDYLWFNPMYHLITAYREVLIHPGRDWSQWAMWKPVATFAMMSIPCYVVGSIVFDRKRERFADEI